MRSLYSFNFYDVLVIEHDCKYVIPRLGTLCLMEIENNRKKICRIYRISSYSLRLIICREILKNLSENILMEIRYVSRFSGDLCEVTLDSCDCGRYVRTTNCKLGRVHKYYKNQQWKCENSNKAAYILGFVCHDAVAIESVINTAMVKILYEFSTPLIVKTYRRFDFVTKSFAINFMKLLYIETVLSELRMMNFAFSDLNFTFNIFKNRFSCILPSLLTGFCCNNNFYNPTWKMFLNDSIEYFYEDRQVIERSIDPLRYINDENEYDY